MIDGWRPMPLKTAQAKKDALIANLVEARQNIQNVASALPASLQVELDDERVHHQQIVKFGGQVISTA